VSGIAGIIHFDGKPVEPVLIERMTGVMAHRGPDGINHWVKGSVARCRQLDEGLIFPRRKRFEGLYSR